MRRGRRLGTEAVMGSRPVWSTDDILEPLMWSPSIDVLAVNTHYTAYSMVLFIVGW